MVTCVFTGHRQIFEPNISEKVKKALEKLIEIENRIVFLNGKMNRFANVCAGAVRTMKEKYPEKEIRNCLVLPYYSNRINTEKSYFQSLYDEILLPEEVECTYYKAAITKRNRFVQTLCSHTSTTIMAALTKPIDTHRRNPFLLSTLRKEQQYV